MLWLGQFEVSAAARTTMPLAFQETRDQLRTTSPPSESKFKCFLFSGPSFSSKTKNSSSIIHVKWRDPVAPATGRKLFWAAGTVPLLSEPQPNGGFESGKKLAYSCKNVYPAAADVLLSAPPVALIGHYLLFYSQACRRDSKNQC